MASCALTARSALSKIPTVDEAAPLPSANGTASWGDRRQDSRPVERITAPICATTRQAPRGIDTPHAPAETIGKTLRGGAGRRRLYSSAYARPEGTDDE